MAADCYIITTPNTRSIVIDGEHDSLVYPGDALGRCDSIEFAINNPDTLNLIGERNRELVAKHDRQVDCAKKVSGAYQQILQSK
jgi:glycosyltransferase involved in cell wall biosynthesis